MAINPAWWRKQIERAATLAQAYEGLLPFDDAPRLRAQNDFESFLDVLGQGAFARILRRDLDRGAVVDRFEAVACERDADRAVLARIALGRSENPLKDSKAALQSTGFWVADPGASAAAPAFLPWRESVQALLAKTDSFRKVDSRAVGSEDVQLRRPVYAACNAYQVAVEDTGPAVIGRILRRDLAKQPNSIDELMAIQDELDRYRMTLELIAVGEACDPVADAKDALQAFHYMDFEPTAQAPEAVDRPEGDRPQG